MWTSKALIAGGAALAVAAGGVAIADASGGGGTQLTRAKGSDPSRAKGSDPSVLGARGVRPQRGRHGFARRLTHGDVHVFVKGRDVQLRIDRGVLKTIGSDSVTLHELDGGDVTVPVDGSTRVMRMGHPAALSDLQVGDVAFTVREAGKPARVVRSPGHPPRGGGRPAD